MVNGSLSVLKFGGSSVGNPDRIRRVAKIIAAFKKNTSDSIVVVVSAMGDTTDDLIALAEKVSPDSKQISHRRELDMLLSSGERISMALLSMALNDLKVQAVSLTGSQSGIVTSSEFGEATIKEIKAIRIPPALAANKVVIVAGFQGVSEEKEITTLGRGGSDTSAVALGIALQAKEVVIYTDVDGFFSADPRKVPGAKKIEEISWQMALEAAARGAQVLHSRCVELAWKYKMPIRVATSFLENAENAVQELAGTKVFGMENQNLESSKVVSVASQSNLTRMSLSGFSNASDLDLFFTTTSLKGLKPLAWNLAGDCLHLLIETKQRELLKGQKIVDERAPLTRYSLVGTGLGRDPLLIKKLCTRLNQSKVNLVEFNQSATTLDFVIPSQSEEFENSLLSEIHQLASL